MNLLIFKRYFFLNSPVILSTFVHSLLERFVFFCFLCSIYLNSLALTMGVLEYSTNY